EPGGELIALSDASLEHDLEPDLAALAGELEQAGDRARSGATAAGTERPSPVFAAALRERLVGQLPMPVAGVGQGGVTVGDAPQAIHVVGATRPLRPVVTRRTPTVLPAPRWTALMAAAVIVLAAVGLNATWISPIGPSSRAGATSLATLTRAGTTTALASGE